MSSDQISLSICGAGGRMGRALIRLAHADPELHLIEALSHATSEYLGYDALVLAGVTMEGGDHALPVTQEHDGTAAVMVDFSSPSGFSSALARAAEHGTAFVTGTTGLEPEHYRQLQEASGVIPVLAAANFSVGVNLLARLAADAARVLKDADIEIIEMHHNRKKDAPSGTAIRLLDAVCDVLGRDATGDSRHGRCGMVGERTKREIGMHALRGGDVVGDHTVLFAAEGERIELTHKASSRDAFARGALLAAKWLAQRPAGVYSIDEVLFS